MEKKEISEEFKNIIRSLPCYDFGDTAPSAYGAFCRVNSEPLDWNKCLTCSSAIERTDPKEMNKAKELAEAHWGYIAQLLTTHGTDDKSMQIIGFHYRTAFEHGFKHGREEG